MSDGEIFLDLAILLGLPTALLLAIIYAVHKFRRWMDDYPLD